MYELLHGKSPFSPVQDIRDRRLYSQTIQTNVIKGNLVFKEGLSKAAVECMEIILCPDPKLRPTAEEILEMDFFLCFELFNKKGEGFKGEKGEEREEREGFGEE